MGLLDSIVDSAFRDEKAGRIVVFVGDRANKRGYIVKSESEELKIRSFLKMFYVAQFSILLLGLLVANAWSTFLIHLQVFGRPSAHLLRHGIAAVGICALVVGLPYFLLWRSYKKALLSFISAQDEVLVSEKPAGQRSWTAVLALILLATFILCGLIVYLVRAK